MPEPLEISPGITVDRHVMAGKPVLRDTRIPVQTILDQLALGLSFERIEYEYEINRDQILAALRYAADTIAREEVRAS